MGVIEQSTYIICGVMIVCTIVIVVTLIYINDVNSGRIPGKGPREKEDLPASYLPKKPTPVIE